MKTLDGVEIKAGSKITIEATVLDVGKEVIKCKMQNDFPLLLEE